MFHSLDLFDRTNRYSLSDGYDHCLQNDWPFLFIFIQTDEPGCRHGAGTKYKTVKTYSIYLIGWIQTTHLIGWVDSVYSAFNWLELIDGTEILIYLFDQTYSSK